MRNFVQNVGKKAAAAGALMFGAIAAAHAELPASIATATAAAETDVKAAGALILGVCVVIAAVAWVRRVIR